MPSTKRVVLVPQYMQHFSCIGSECEDTCCGGWTVSIDRKTYKNYKNLRDRELSPLIEENITRVRTNASDQNYATIKLTEDKLCPFLTSEKLCSFQAKFGEKYLSNVCRTYPRVLNVVNGVLEKSSTLSCPEAARLALLNPNIMEFDEIEEDVDSSMIVNKHINTSSPTDSNTAKKYIWELRIFTIRVLQNRKYPLPDRLIFLGIFYDKVQQLIEDQNIDEIPQLINSYTSLMHTLQNSISEIPSSIDIQLQLVKRLMELRVLIGVNNRAYLECVKETLEGIQYSDQSSLNQLAQCYRDSYETYFSPFISKHEYVLENYLVNYVFKNLFPFSTHNDKVYEDYVLMVIHYSMIKLHLIGMAGYHKEKFSSDHVVKLIYSFGKAVEHSPTYLYKLVEILKRKEETSLAHMAILIKN
jgi:lysine-N-methylase